MRSTVQFRSIQQFSSFTSNAVCFDSVPTGTTIVNGDLLFLLCKISSKSVNTADNDCLVGFDQLISTRANGGPRSSYLRTFEMVTQPPIDMQSRLLR